MLSTHNPSAAASPPPRALFVDDDPLLLRSIRRLMRQTLPTWELAFATSAEAALEHLATRPVNIVVSDLCMDGMDGARFLRRVQANYPAAVRIILSGTQEATLSSRTVKVAHQYLAKPLDVRTLGDTLLSVWEAQRRLPSSTVRQLVAGEHDLPAAPTVYFRLVDALSDDEVKIETIVAIVESDVGLAARLVQIASSAFFGRLRSAKSVREAVVHLGLSLTKALVLTIEIVHAFRPRCAGFSIDGYQQQALSAGRLVCLMGDGLADPSDVFLAGLLSDVGKLVLASRCPEPYSRALSLSQAPEVPDWQAERECCGATHAEVGAYLLGLWGLSPRVLCAAAGHHPSAGSLEQTDSLVAVVHVAQHLALDPDTPIRHAGSDPPPGIDERLLDLVGGRSHLRRWREAARLVREG